MTKEDLGSWLQFILAAAIAGVTAYCAMTCHGGATTPPETVVKTDTLVVYHTDTIIAYKPVPFNVYVVDTLYVPVTVGRDTVWAELPREAKEYRDSTYRAVVSGFRPSLDEIEVYQRTRTVTVTNTVQLPAPRWSWGVQTGVGYSPTGGISPYIGVGIQYRIGDLTLR